LCHLSMAWASGFVLGISLCWSALNTRLHTIKLHA